ncbi:hypothetical protein D1007_51856 [Hordeum vulgare]|nr:hypothetical protein D1007_51856 [Hordeum vulgare]
MQPLIDVLLAAAALLTAVAMAASPPAAMVSSPPAAINTTCSVVTAHAYPDYEYCVNVLSSSDASPSRDGRGLAVIAANATARSVTHTVGIIDDLLHGLTRCSGFYGLMADNVSSTLGDLVAGRDPSESTYWDAYGLGPLNCFIELTECWSFCRDPLAQENRDNTALVLFAMNVAMLIPKSSGSLDHRPSGALAAAGASSPDIINTTCSSLSYSGYPGYDYCVSVLSSGSAARDTRDLAIAATNATAHNITSTVKLIEGLLSDLAECKLSYGGRMGKTVASALGDLVVGRALLGAANKLADASRDAVDCDAVMSKRRGIAKNVLYQENAENFVSAHFASNVVMYAVN